MKNVLLSMILIVILSTSIFGQNWTPPERGKTRIGVIGNIWQPIGLIVNHDFDSFGVYATAKADVNFQPELEFRQYNFTAGLSIPIFTNTSKSYYSDLLVGISYITEPDGTYINHSYTWGGEVLLMLPFTDKDFRFIIGWSSNSIVWSEGVTAGFAYQF